MKLAIKKGSTSKLVEVFIQDSSSTTGAGLTGLVFNTASLTAYYYRSGAASSTAMTLATMTLGTWATLGFIVVDATNMPGVYQIGIPDAALASGADQVIVHLKGATNMAPLTLEIQLTDVDLNDGVRAGLTALPNAAAEAAGGLATSAGGATGIDDLATPTNITAGTITTVTTLTNLPAITSNWLTAAGIAASALDGKGNWNIGKTGYSISGTKTTLDALNDIAATSIVSGGAINTTTGAVDNVTLVATTTTNSDMRGTDSAALASSLATAQLDLDTITGADGATLATAQGLYAPAKATDIVTGGAITTAGGAVSNVTLVATTTTNTDMVAAAPTVASILTTQMTESYAAADTAPTLAQALFYIHQALGDFSISGTTITVNKLGAGGTAGTHTLDDATNPTSSNRAT